MEQPQNHAGVVRWALRRLLTMSATIGRIAVPDFGGDHLQGVQLDSLESFRVLGAQEGHNHAKVQEPNAGFFTFGAPD